MKNYISYKEIAKHLDIQKGDVVHISSDVLRLILTCRENGEKFDADTFIDTILERVGPEGTVFFPTYFWSFCRGQTFDYRHTLSQTGGLSNAALKRKDFRRTKHPIYSFAVWGKDQDLLCNMNNVNCFSKDSPFGYMYDNDVKNLFVGLDYKLGLAFVHYAEEIVGVDFRYFKDFTGPYIDEAGVAQTATARMYVRDLAKKVNTEIHPRLDKVLLEKNLYKPYSFNDIYFGMVNLRGVGDVMMDDLTTKGGLVYAKPV